MAAAASAVGGIAAKAIDYSLKRRTYIQNHEESLVERLQKRIEKLEEHVQKCNEEMKERVLEIGGLRKTVEHLEKEVIFWKGQK